MIKDYITAIIILGIATILQRYPTAFVWAYEGTTYYLPGQPNAWLFPAGELIGMALQLVAIWLKKLKLLLAGTVLVLIAAFFERDISLALGDLLAAAGLWYCLSPAKN